MSIQPYKDPGQELALYHASQRSQEEIEKIVKEAEELDKKLRHIVEDVPDRVYHTMSSIAGASSSDFHTYRHSRRREQDRLRKMEEDHKREELNKKFQENLETKNAIEDAKTAARRAKRQKEKEKKRNKKRKIQASEEEWATKDEAHALQPDLD